MCGCVSPSSLISFHTQETVIDWLVHETHPQRHAFPGCRVPKHRVYVGSLECGEPWVARRAEDTTPAPPHPPDLCPRRSSNWAVPGNPEGRPPRRTPLPSPGPRGVMRLAAWKTSSPTRPRNRDGCAFLARLPSVFPTRPLRSARLSFTC